MQLLSSILALGGVSMHLAQSPTLSLPPPTSYEATGWLFVALGGLLFAIDKALGIWDKVRAKPGNHEVFASKKEVEAELAKSNRRFENIEAQLHDGASKYAALNTDMAVVRFQATHLKEQIGSLLSDMKDLSGDIKELNTLSAHLAERSVKGGKAS